METLEEVGLVDLIDVAAQLSALGRGKKHLTRNLRQAGYVLHIVHRQRGRSGFAITKADAEKYLSSFKNRIIKTEHKITVSEKQRHSEEQVRQQRESEGWFSFRLSSPGMPDLIHLKPRDNGGFEVLFEEVKGPGDGIRKDQHSTLEDLKQKGIPAVVTWL
jgi:hypothetical protein